ncbi:DNA-processing protein DprA [bacterium]|nr:DNA-processing protein DprA [bacterium]
MTDIIDILSLYSIPGLGSVSIKKIFEKFNKSDDLFLSKKDELLHLIGGQDISFSKEDLNKSVEYAKRQLDIAEKNGVSVISFMDKGYPKLLKEIYDAPALLFFKGDLSFCDERTIAIVGNRLASDYGIKTADYFSKVLVENSVTVVSGMARGIDSAAHKGVLDAGGHTIAVIGCGLDITYPPENGKLKKEIEEKGLIVSEYPMGTEPLAHNFPRRNRIISGLSYGTVVVEGGLKSGALITAQMCLDQGREVFAVPGSIYNKRSQGSHHLIRQGAVLVENVHQILEEIPGWDETKVVYNEEERREMLTGEEKIVWDSMSYEPVHIDTLVSSAGKSTSYLLALLLSMELKGLVKQLSGMMFIKV